MKQAFRLRLGIALLAFSAVSIAPARAQVQRTPPAKAAAAPDTSGGGTFITPHTANTQNLAKAEQEDEEYVFRHSASVRAFGRLFHLGPDAASMGFWGLNFLVLAAAVGYVLLKGLPKVFRGRRESIEKQLVEARTATEEANQRLRGVEDRLSRLDAEIAAIREGAERDSARDEEHIKAAIEEERRKISASAEGEIAAAGAAAERQLRRFAAELAVERAAARIHLSEEDDRRLIRQFAAGIAPDGRNGGSR